MADKILQNRLSRLEKVLYVYLLRKAKAGDIVFKGKQTARSTAQELRDAIESVSSVIVTIKGGTK